MIATTDAYSYGYYAYYYYQNLREFKCDAKTGPQQGKCPVAKCLVHPKGCIMKKEFTKMGDDTCCPKPCNFVHANGKECKPGPWLGLVVAIACIPAAWILS